MTEIAVLPKDELARMLDEYANRLIERIQPQAQPAEHPEYWHRALWKTSEVADYLGVSPSNMSRLKRSPDFPAPVQIDGLKSDRWRADDIRRWVRTRKQLT